MAAAIKLKQKELTFCNEYQKGSSATQACIAAGYSVKGAAVQGNRMLRKANIKQYLEEKKNKQIDKAEITIERIVTEYAKVALFDIRQLHNKDGSFIPISELNDDCAAAIAGIEIYEEKVKGKLISRITKVRLNSKLQALEGLSKIIGAYKKDNEQSAPHSQTNIQINLTPDKVRAYDKALEGDY